MSGSVCVWMGCRSSGRVVVFGSVIVLGEEIVGVM